MLDVILARFSAIRLSRRRAATLELRAARRPRDRFRHDNTVFVFVLVCVCVCMCVCVCFIARPARSRMHPRSISL